ncbi:MAG: sporulation protein [Methanomicrobia archaeon]|nr:sporulation protein [Methanomicrobia archaeon]
MGEELKGVIAEMLAEFQKIISVEAAVGTPIEFEDKVLIPVFSIGFGAGGGGGATHKEKEGAGYGVGGGGGLSPVALVAVFKGISGPEGLKVLSLKPSGALDKIVGEALPTVMEKVTEMRADKTAESAKTET